MAEKLLPCPFCGKNPKVLARGSIMCSNDSCSAGPMAMMSMFASKKACVKGWNHRPQIKEEKIDNTQHTKATIALEDVGKILKSYPREINPNFAANLIVEMEKKAQQ